MNKYGDIEKVKSDIKTLNEILERQGSSLLIDCIAEKTGNSVNKFKLNKFERMSVLNSLVEEFKESLLERI